MNKELFCNCLKDTDNLTKDSINQLTEIIKDFPYCQSARILLTTTLFREQNIRYENELRTTAIYVGNRGILRKHVNQIGKKEDFIVLPDEHVEKVVVKTNEDKEKPEVKTGSADSISELKKIVKEHITDIETETEQKSSDEVKETRPKKSKSDLIDEFIKNEPGITRQKSAFFNPVKAARISIVDEENIISETLAKIYTDQGLFEKAISTYKKLSLKFPEKSTYFAALIEKAEKELEI